MCEECERLWRHHREVSHKSLRLEERLRQAEAVQDHDAAKVFAARLASLMQEQKGEVSGVTAERALVKAGMGPKKADYEWRFIAGTLEVRVDVVLRTTKPCFQGCNLGV
jgi:hypothetical protein